MMTAKDLLHILLDYQYGWSNISDKPATIRLAQIAAMQEAFGLTKKNINPLLQINYFIQGKRIDRVSYLSKRSNLDYLLGGEFLKDRPYEHNNIIAQRALAAVKELFPHAPEDRMSRPVDIAWLYNDLLHFRMDIYKITYPWGGMLEGFSVGLHYSQLLQRKLKEVIKNNLEEIDETLWLLLDPAKRYIEKEVLISQYAFPDEDLDRIDHDWRMENY